MKELVCIDAKDTELVENEVYHLEDIVSCDICDVGVSYILFESKPLPHRNNCIWFCLKCKQEITNPSNKMPYSPSRFIELDELDASELMDIVQEKVPVANSRIIIDLPQSVISRLLAV